MDSVFTLCVLIFVEFILRLFIKPIFELRKQIAETINLLDYYACELQRFDIPKKKNSNKSLEEELYDSRKNKEIERREQASIAFRKNGFSIRSKMYAISLYKFKVFERLKIIPKEKTVLKIVRYNTALSNSVFSESKNATKRIEEDIAETNKLLKEVYPNYKDKYEELEFIYDKQMLNE